MRDGVMTSEIVGHFVADLVVISWNNPFWGCIKTWRFFTVKCKSSMLYRVWNLLQHPAVCRWDAAKASNRQTW